MNRKSECKKALRLLKKTCPQGRRDDAAAVRRACGGLTRDRAFFASFSRDGFDGLLETVRAACPDAVLPDTAELAERLEQSGCTLTVAQDRHLPALLRYWLLSCAADACRTGDAETLGRVVRSLFTLRGLDFPLLTRRLCAADKLYSAERAGIYPDMDEPTKRQYLAVTRREAERLGVSDRTVAERAVRLADERGVHVGFVLPLFRPRKREGTALLVVARLLALWSALSIGVLTDSSAAGLLSVLPLTELFLCLSRRRSGAPLPVCRMDPTLARRDKKTVIAVSALLPSPQRIEQTRRHLLSLYAANRRSARAVCLLADLPACDRPEAPQDRIRIEAAVKMIDSLNEVFPDAFALALRERSYSETERRYIGRERKRGAVLALTRFMSTGVCEFALFHGARDAVADCTFVMLLDSDSVLPFDGLTPLICAALHPLNRPVVDGESGLVRDGYGILSPDVAPSVRSFSSTRFARDMCSVGGVSAYTRAGSDFYADLFGDGIFCGKGLVHAETFYRVLNGAFPDERILSHDVAEGLLLRVLAVTDVTLTDDFPSSETAYFKRQHRWIRGDVQNLALLARHVTLYGKKRKTPFSPIGRYKLYDNLRRALLPVFSAVGVLASTLLPPVPSAVLCAVCLLSPVAGDLLAAVGAVLGGGMRALSGLYKEDAIPTALSGLIRAFLKTTQLFFDACTDLDAVFRALWRMTISHRRLLSWTTAAASDGPGSVREILLSRLPCVAAAVLLFLSRRPLCILAGLFTLFDLVYAIRSRHPLRESRRVLSEKEREKLMDESAAIWRYFADTLRPETHFLPPDNVCVAPLPDTAERTSPTNIGLALCACLCARDMGFIDSGELFRLLDGMLSGVERLEKWKGNLLNWYDIRTLEPLRPVFVSFVDSGNFLCCLTALREGLTEYVGEDVRLGAIAERLDALKKACRLDAFYDPNRRLFSIGYDRESGRLSDSFYDLLMSEARMASFLAVSTGRVPAEHWRSLSREAARCGRYCGALSWSGTMFEYFMPGLFLPSRANTLTDESLWFCFKSQVRFAEKHRIPWGISESCFYAFNDRLNYHYKANGVPTAALRQSVGSDLTVSPYSTFLALPFVPRAAMENLRRLEKYHVRGKYGFYEALDFTPGRTAGGEPSVVACFMAHHLGMSLLSCANALFEHIWQRRFMRDVLNAAAEGLLEEKIDVCVTRGEKAREPKTEEKEKRRGRAARDLPAALYDSGGLSAAFHESGCLRLSFGGVCVLRPTGQVLGEPSGIFAAVRTADGVYPFTRAPWGEESGEFRTVFTGRFARYTAVYPDVKLSMRAFLCREEPGLRLELSVRNLKNEPLDASLEVYCEPSLAHTREENAHRAYAKLFIRSSYREKTGAVVFTRQTASGKAALAVGLPQTVRHFTTEKTCVFPPLGGIGTLFRRNAQTDDRCGSTDCCFFARTSFTAGARREMTFPVLLTVGRNGREAETRYATLAHRSEEPFYAKAFTHNSTEDALAASLLCDAVFPNRRTVGEAERAAENTSDVTTLWAAEISGDDPIVVLDSEGAEESVVRGFAAAASRLNVCGMAVDPVVLYDGEKSGGKKPGGLTEDGTVHLIDRTTCGDRLVPLLRAAACGRYPRDDRAASVDLPVLEDAPPFDPDGRPAGFEGSGFWIPSPPPVPWCRTLANRSFGCLVSDRGLGFTWAVNSAENKLSLWTNDPFSDRAGELLTAQFGGRTFDLLRAAAARLDLSSAEWRSRCGGCVFISRVRVPETGMLKYLSVSVKNTASEPVTLTVGYTICPQMGRTTADSRFLTKEPVRGGMLFGNPYNSDFGGCLFVRGKHVRVAEPLLFRRNCGLSDGVSLLREITLPPDGEETVEFTLSWAKTKTAAVRLTELSLPEQTEKVPGIDTGDGQTDALVNLCLPHQILRTRLYARCGFYQCGGAYGFRDQLQDCMNLLPEEPSVLKRQLFRSAAAQFEEGDVLHWWHVTLRDGGQYRRGVRTRCSDDLLWLPCAAAVYVETTGDRAVLEKPIPFCTGETLREGEKDRCFSVGQSDVRATLYEHCVRALDRACRTGAHGLLLMGSGDWNDSFDAVGARGLGESVWLSQFYVLTVKKFLPICRLMGDAERAGRYDGARIALEEAIDRHAWDGDRYIRAFYDDGEPMGAKGCRSCEIDLLVQAFASLAELPDKGRVRKALMTAWELLYDEKNRLVKLFSPAFTPDGKRTGYVNFYPEGVRENGGQYTHAAAWYIMALNKEGYTVQAEQLFRALDPLTRLSGNTTGVYRAEPYAMAGDVYALKNFEGQAGWSLYTGSAGWMLRAARELFGK